MNTLRVGVIGLGKKGLLYDLEDTLRTPPHTHVFAFDMYAETSLVAVCDEDAETRFRCEKAFPAIPVYGNLTKMLITANLDILSIATPVETHCDIVRAAANFGGLKAIFVEKPIATSVREAELMIRSCEMHNVKLIVNHQRRWDANWLTAFHNLESIGPLRKMIAYCSGDPLEAGIHMADLLLWFGPGIPYHYIDLMDGKPYDPYLIFELDIFGDKGRLTISDNGAKISLFNVEKSKRYTGFNELQFHHNPAPLTQISPLIGAIRNIVAVIQGFEEPTVSGYDGLRALELALEWKQWNE